MVQKQDGSDRAPVTAAAKLHLWQFQAVRDVLVIAALVGLFWLGYALRTVTVPLLVALLLAYLFEPVVSSMVRRTRYSRTTVVAGLMSSVGLVVALILLVVTIAIVGQTTRLIQDIRSGEFQARATMVWNWVPEEYRDMYQEWRRSILGDEEGELGAPQMDDEAAGNDAEEGDQRHANAEIDDDAVTGDGGPAAADDAARASDVAVADGLVMVPGGQLQDWRDEQWVRELAREEALLMLGAESAAQDESVAWIRNWMRLVLGGVDAVWHGLASLIGIGFMVFLIPFYFFYFSVAFPTIREFGQSLIPEANRARTLELLSKMDRVIAGFVRGRIIVSLLMGVGFAIGWWIVGVPYAIVLGFVIGLFCAVPYLGIVGVPIAVGLLLFAQLDPEGGLNMSLWAILFWPTFVFVVVQLIESYLLTPAIAGKATNLDPVTIIVAVIAGGSIMGIYGMLLAVPVAACLKILITDVLLPKIRAWTRGEAADPLPID